MEPTIDPGIVIVERTDEGVVYERSDGVRWIIRGECNRCGLCEVGNTPDRDAVIVWTGVLGEPGAVLDLTYGQRPDFPLLPEAPGDYGAGPTGGRCSLSGEYLP